MRKTNSSKIPKLIQKKRRIIRKTIKMKPENLTVVPLTTAINSEELLSMIMSGKLLPAKYD
jgi:uncharacterized protein YifN (PemK superfamily)